MKIRQKIKQEEDWIRNLIHQDGDQDSAAIRAWRRTLDYFLTNDFLDGHNHVEIIVYIYTTKRYLSESIYCFAWKNYIGERTLYRYRKKYIRCFKHYYEEESKRGEKEDF